MKFVGLSLVALILSVLLGCRLSTAPAPSTNPRGATPARVAIGDGEVVSIHGNSTSDVVRFRVRAGGLDGASWHLFLDTDNADSTGYGRFGAEFIVNAAVPGPLVPVQVIDGGWRQVTGYAAVEFDHGALVISVPRAAIGGVGSLGFAFFLIVDGKAVGYAEGEVRPEARS